MVIRIPNASNAKLLRNVGAALRSRDSVTPEPPDSVSSVTQGNITWNFASPVPALETVDGAWVVEGPVTISSVTPTLVGTGADTRNGLTINPLWEGDASHVGQGWDGRDITTFDQSMEGSSFPLVLTGGSVAVKGASATVTVAENQDRAGWLDEVSALFVVDNITALPQTSVFSPSPIGWTGRSGFQWWTANTSAANSLPTWDVTNQSSRIPYATVAAKVARWQGVVGYSTDLSAGGYQAWLLFETGRDESIGDTLPAMNYGQWVISNDGYHEAALLGLIGNEWSPSEKSTLLTAMATHAVHLAQLGQGASGYKANMPTGLGGHMQFQQPWVDCASLMCPSFPSSGLRDIIVDNQILQTFIFDQDLLDRFVQHDSSSEPMDYRRRPVSAIDTSIPGEHTATVDFGLGGERPRWEPSKNKWMRATDGSISTLVRTIDEIKGLHHTGGTIDVPVEDATGFDGKTVYFEPTVAYQVGEASWCVSDIEILFNRYDVEAFTAYVQNNNRYSGGVLFALANNLTDSQRLPFIRWTEARYFGHRGLDQPFETPWGEEFWQEHYQALFAETIGEGGYRPDAPVISNPTDEADGNTDFTGTVSTTGNSGTLLYRVYAAADTPTDAEVLAGTGSVVAESQPVTTTGVQSVSGTGLTLGTDYRLHYVHSDPYGAESNTVAADGFTTTSSALSDPFYANTAYFLDTVNTPASTTVVEYEAKFIPSATLAVTNAQLFGQVSGGGLRAGAAGKFQITGIEDSAGTVIMPAPTAFHVPVDGEIETHNLLIDFDNDLITYKVDGVTIEAIAMNANTGSTQSSKKQTFNSLSGTDFGLVPDDWKFEYFKLWLTTSSVRTLHKEISVAALGSIANINSDSWLVGGAVVGS